MVVTAPKSRTRSKSRTKSKSRTRSKSRVMSKSRTRSKSRSNKFNNKYSKLLNRDKKQFKKLLMKLKEYNSLDPSHHNIIIDMIIGHLNMMDDKTLRLLESKAKDVLKQLSNSKSRSKSMSYRKAGGASNLYEDCENNNYEDGIPIDPIDAEKIPLNKKVLLGRGCYNKESICKWLLTNPTDPLTRETVPDEWIREHCDVPNYDNIDNISISPVTRILVNIIYYTNNFDTNVLLDNSVHMIMGLVLFLFLFRRNYGMT